MASRISPLATSIARTALASLILLAVMLWTTRSFCQAAGTGETPGMPPFASVSGGQYDHINLHNLAIELDIAVGKTGKSIFMPSSVTPNGITSVGTPEWVLNNQGFADTSRPNPTSLSWNGYSSTMCGTWVNTAGNFKYTDPSGQRLPSLTVATAAAL